MQVYIAEKPSVAKEIIKWLPGPLIDKRGYYQKNEAIVTWLFGHVLRMANPDEYDARYKQWNAADLPIIPVNWKLCVSDSCAEQFTIVKGLIAQANEIINTGDPDREGQLLVDEVLEFVGNKKPVKRMLLNALDEKSIKKALEDIRNNDDFQGLKESALARQRADWLIGMNLSRAYTLMARNAGYQITFPIGRVKTPTLALVVRREREILNFKPIDYFGFKIDLLHQNGAFTAVWKAKETQHGLDSEGRLVDLNVVGELKNKFLSKKGHAVITEFETKEKSVPQPLPYSLSALQVAAGKRFGYSPQLVLDTAQALYEKKLTTYPRSDCDNLPENQFLDGERILAHLTTIAELRQWAALANPGIKSRAWNDKKVSAHHAIIPTEMTCVTSKLTEVEKNIYLLIAQSYIAQFYPVHIYDQTNVILAYQEEEFKASGRVVKIAGWREMFINNEPEKEEKTEEESQGLLPLMQKGDSAAFSNLKPVKSTTKPPERFTESTLLQAMKEIHKYVKNEDLKKQLKSVSGIGTEATRAGIIKDLLSRQFLQLNKKLTPTEAAYTLIDALPDELTYPDTTALWEEHLKQMETGSGELQAFLAKQSTFVTDLCKNTKKQAIKTRTGHVCPKCEAGVLIQKTGPKGVFWGCSCYREGCSASYQDLNGEPDTNVYPCPKCKTGTLKLRNGSKGPFWACDGFPNCRNTCEDNKGKPKPRKSSKNKYKK